MGIRSTSTENTGFIYDSVTGIAVGEVWEDVKEMDAFLESHADRRYTIDLRLLTITEINSLRDKFHNIWIKS